MKEDTRTSFPDELFRLFLKWKGLESLLLSFSFPESLRGVEPIFKSYMRQPFGQKSNESESGERARQILSVLCVTEKK